MTDFSQFPTKQLAKEKQKLQGLAFQGYSFLREWFIFSKTKFSIFRTEEYLITSSV
jgi:hypothetical protein